MLNSLFDSNNIDSKSIKNLWTSRKSDNRYVRDIYAFKIKILLRENAKK